MEGLASDTVSFIVAINLSLDFFKWVVAVKLLPTDRVLRCSVLVH